MTSLKLNIVAVATGTDYNAICDRITDALEGICDSVRITVAETLPETCPACGRPGVCPEVVMGGVCSLPRERRDVVTLPHSSSEEAFLESADDDG